MDFYNVLREGHLVKEGTSAVSWESLQPLDAWAIKGGVSPTGPPGFPTPRREAQGTRHTTKLSKLSFIEFQWLPLGLSSAPLALIGL